MESTKKQGQQDIESDSNVALDGFIILVDTREKKPWAFETSRKQKLDLGDYSVAGLEHSVAIERKSLADLIGSVIHDWDRFRRELEKLSKYRLARVVVESSIENILAHSYEGKVSPESIMGRCVTIEVNIGVPIVWGSTRQHARHYAEKILRSSFRRWGK